MRRERCRGVIGAHAREQDNRRRITRVTVSQRISHFPKRILDWSRLERKSLVA
jgi:hypothetical protein